MKMHKSLSTVALAAASFCVVNVAHAQVIDIKDGGFSFTFGGQINRGILSVDDGVDTREFSVDNDNSSTRLRARAAYSFGDYVVGGQIEYEFEFSSTAAVNQLNSDVSSSVANERKFELFAETPYGNFAYGQGDTASNGTSEVDLSGTTVVGYSGVSDLAGGILFRDQAGALTTQRIGGNFSNLDGNSRQERFRYDTPVFADGVVVSVSFGEDSRNGIALRYKNDFGDFAFSGALSYNEREGADRVNGSASVLHNPTGVSFTFASGEDSLDNSDQDPSFYYVKLGYERDFFKFGSTAFSVDYYDGSDISSLGSDSDSFGLLAVQNIDRHNLEVYAGYRSYSASAATADFQDIDALLVGARFKF
ncbi:MAG: porin [Sulfitobacter sp.]